VVTFLWLGEDNQTWSFRGSKSRNKVSVGEPAEGSLLVRKSENDNDKTITGCRLYMLTKSKFSTDML
jgi:cytochrome c oxidase assembly protein Cox11